MGLDPATVRSISNLLHRLAEKQAPRLILALRPQDTVPDWITHMIVVGNQHRIVLQDTKEAAQKTLNTWSKFVGHRPGKGASLSKDGSVKEVKAYLESGALDEQLIKDLTSSGARKIPKATESNTGGEVLIEMDGVRVQYGDKAVLGDWKQSIYNKYKEGLHWSVRRGQRWAILGANGSGKTTLLSLITSDHPQTYALPIKLFGRSRLPEVGKPGISIFELQSRIGHSSPEIHAFFPRQLTIRQSLESAFAETFLSKPKLSSEIDADITAVLTFFKSELDPTTELTGKETPMPTVSTDMFPTPVTPKSTTGSRIQLKPAPYVPEEFYVGYADKFTFGQLTTAQQRIVLFLRALIHKPDIVILDEPFSGLSASQREKCLHFLEHGDSTYPHSNRMSSKSGRIHGLSDEQALIMISHVMAEIPDTVRHFMRLPSPSVDGEAALDFRFGVLKQTSHLNDAEVWQNAWGSPKEFDQHRRAYMKSHKRKDFPGHAADMDKYMWSQI